MVRPVFRRFVIENDSEYANPTNPQYDLWKHAQPAIRHEWDGTIYTGKRGEDYDTIYKRVPSELYDQERQEKCFCEGIYNIKENKFYERGEDTNMDATDLMTNLQRYQLKISETA